MGARVRAITHYDSRAEQSNLEFVSEDVRSSLEVIPGDVTDPWFVSRVLDDQDTVFHLAALIAIPYSYRAPASYVKTNVEGTLNVLEAFRTSCGRKLVHTSTSEVYGTAQYTPIDEQHPLQGQSPYSASKIGADKIAESYFLSFDTPVVTLRPFNTYGPRQSARAVIPTIIAQCLSQSSEIQLGDLRTVRDFNFVLDTVDAFLEVASNDSCIGETFNAGSGEVVTIRETAEMILRLTGANKEIREDASRMRPEKSEVRVLRADASKLMSATKWQPRYSLEQGLKRTIDFVRNHIDTFRPGTNAI